MFALECLRIGRLAGDVKKEDAYTVSSVIGQERKTPALAHMLFKKQDLVEFVVHEAWLVGESLVQAVAAFRTPLGIWKKFQTSSGEQSLVAAIRKGVSAPGERLESQFALRVAEFRDQDQHDIKAQTLMDLLWGVWGSTFDDEFMELCSQKMKATAPTTFIWHRYLQDSKEAVCAGLRKPPPATSGARFDLDDLICWLCWSQHREAQGGAKPPSPAEPVTVDADLCFAVHGARTRLRRKVCHLPHAASGAPPKPHHAAPQHTTTRHVTPNQPAPHGTRPNA